MVHDPYLPCDVPRQSGGSTQIPSLTDYEPKSVHVLQSFSPPHPSPLAHDSIYPARFTAEWRIYSNPISCSPTANSLTDRLGAGQRRKHIDTRYFWIQERVQEGDLSIKKVPTAKTCADVGTKPVSASALQQHCKFAGLVFY